MRFLIAAVSVLLGLVASGAALAHPHVWIDARAELIFDDQNRMVAVRHVWRFDEGFSAYATQGLDENGDGVLSRKELDALAQLNMESLETFEYFTYVQNGSEDPAYGAPEEYWLTFENGLLTLFFRLPMEKPVAADPVKGFKDLTVEVFDPTFFVDLTFVEDDPVLLAGAVESCLVGLEPRKELDIFQTQLLAQIPADENIPEDIAPAQGDLSNTIRVNCGAS
ncbi:MAG: DUF1007 family protein [Pseudomonadota bacterium]